jgi:hypothetical protein
MRSYAMVVVLCLSTSLFAGCNGALNIDGDDIAALLANAVGLIQTRQQELPPVLEGDHTILIDNSVTIINNPAQDIIVVELPNRTVLGFENDTGWDIYIQYFADNELQGVYVYDGEALLLDYPCLSVIELVSEDDVNPNTGELENWYDLTGSDFFNPDDFLCGDALILTFDPFSVTARAEVVDLLP